jgi:hypothetical protein
LIFPFFWIKTARIKYLRHTYVTFWLLAAVGVRGTTPRGADPLPKWTKTAGPTLASLLRHAMLKRLK